MFNSSPYFEVFKYAVMIGAGVGGGLAVVSGLRKVGEQGLTTLMFGRGSKSDAPQASLDDDTSTSDVSKD
jgi:hypothetical protein